MIGAAPLLAQQTTRSIFEWARIQTGGDWVAPLATFVAFGIYARFMYLRDSVELNRLTRRVLLGLRLTTGLLLLAAYLQPQWRNEADMIANSRVALAVDTSSSMAHVDAADPPVASAPRGVSRSQQVIDNFAGGELLDELRSLHDVVVWRFDRDIVRLATLPRIAPPADATADSTSPDLSPWQGRNLLRVLAVAVPLFVAGGVWFVAVRQARGRGGPIPACLIVVSAGAIAGAGGLLAWHHTPASLLELAGLKTRSESTDASATPDASKAGTPDWEKWLVAQGGETRLGEAIKQVLDEERGAPLAGIVAITDGQQNAGLDLPAAQAAAAEARTPVFTVGVGSNVQPANVRIVDFQAPQRAYPGDRFSVAGTLQHQGMAGQNVVVELTSRPAGAGGEAPAASRVEGALQVALEKEGETIGAPFELPAPKEEDLGRRVYRLVVRPAQPDPYPTDDAQEAEIEIVDRKTRVLLFAGGPSKEYQFLRNQLRRGSDAQVDVYLQSGQPGMSQDAHEILPVFPATRNDLFDYDCVVAIDPDWRQLTPQQHELLETWVGEQAGGLVVVPGRVFASLWTDVQYERTLAKIRALYPVDFPRARQLLQEEVEPAAREPHRLEFTREGLAAEFLGIEDDPAASRDAWAEFDGVYDVFPVRGPKPGATVYAHYSTAEGAEQGEMPVYMAGHFYGLGRVFYLGSGEMWRLRAYDDAWLERFYAKVIRQVSQGRLLRGSKRGLVLTDSDRYLLGATVDVRAQISNAQLEPLDLERVEVEVIYEGKKLKTIELLKDATRAGTYRGQMAAREAGAYQLELHVPESNDEVLMRSFKVRVPDLERERVARDDARLRELAERTGGAYFAGLSAVAGEGTGGSLAARLPDKSRTVTLPLTPDPLWDNSWVMTALASLLGIEWLLRRLVKLA